MKICTRGDAICRSKVQEVWSYGPKHRPEREIVCKTLPSLLTLPSAAPSPVAWQLLQPPPPCSSYPGFVWAAPSAAPCRASEVVTDVCLVLYFAWRYAKRTELVLYDPKTRSSVFIPCEKRQPFDLMQRRQVQTGGCQCSIKALNRCVVLRGIVGLNTLGPNMGRVLHMLYII